MFKAIFTWIGYEFSWRSSSCCSRDYLHISITLIWIEMTLSGWVRIDSGATNLGHQCSVRGIRYTLYSVGIDISDKIVIACVFQTRTCFTEIPWYVRDPEIHSTTSLIALAYYTAIGCTDSTSVLPFYPYWAERTYRSFHKQLIWSQTAYERKKRCAKFMKERFSELERSVSTISLAGCAWQ